jgi:hypothetical protein
MIKWGLEGMPMLKVDWTLLWQRSCAVALALVCEVIAVSIAKIENPLVIVIGGVLLYFLLLAFVQIVWTLTDRGIRKILQRRDKPKIQLDFKLLKDNDLRLYIHNPPGEKSIHVECSHQKYADSGGRDYVEQHRNRTLFTIENSPSGSRPLFSDTLTQNDTREFILSEEYKGKLALRIYSTLTVGFLDGRYEYIVSCTTNNHQGKKFKMPNSSVWLIIKNGVLVKIEKDLYG